MVNARGAATLEALKDRHIASGIKLNTFTVSSNYYHVGWSVFSMADKQRH
jgi:hypothetical protein